MDKHFVSELDKFIAEFDSVNGRLSESQKEEIQKASHLSQWRDDPEAAKKAQEEL